MIGLLWTFGLASGLAWGSPQTDYEAGIAALRDGQSAQAVDNFVDALNGGGQDPAVYHGLGNALYRQDHLGAAIAAWSRGQRLTPGNGDITANLERARKQTKDRLTQPTIGFGPFFWQKWISPLQSATLASILLTLGLGVWAGMIAGRKPRWPWGTVAALLCGLGGLLIASTGWVLQQGATAIVVQPALTVQSALGPEGVDLFVLHEGAEVIVLEETRNGSTLIGLSDGRKGWAPQAALISTDPDAPFPIN